MEKRQLITRSTTVITIFLILIFASSYIYSYVEGWSYFDSLYFTVVTVTTIGYGDIVPKTVIGKTFTMFFPFIGVALAFYLFSLVGKYVLRQNFEEKIRERLGIDSPKKLRK